MPIAWSIERGKYGMETVMCEKERRTGRERLLMKKERVGETAKGNEGETVQVVKTLMERI